MTLVGRCTELRGPSLVGDLDRAEWRQVAVHEYGLNIAPVDGGIRLQKHPEEQVSGEELIGADDMDPCVGIIRIGIER